MFLRCRSLFFPFLNSSVLRQIPGKTLSKRLTNKGMDLVVGVMIRGVYPKIGSLFTCEQREQVDERGMSPSEGLFDVLVDILERVVLVQFVKFGEEYHIARNLILLASLNDCQQRCPIGFPGWVRVGVKRAIVSDHPIGLLALDTKFPNQLSDVRSIPQAVRWSGARQTARWSGAKTTLFDR